MKKLIIFLILIFLNISLLANVTLHSSNSFVKGEAFVFEFEVVGTSIEFPKIDKIDGYIVESLGTSRSLQIINGNYDEKLSKKYRIVPNSDFTIPSFTFKVGGKEIHTEAKKIIAQKVIKTASNDFDLTLLSSKNSLYVGEEFKIKLIFKYKRGLQITNLGFEQPNFENFWYKKIDDASKRYEDGGYIVQELEFLLFPQKSGELTIEPLRVDVQMLDSNNPGGFGFFSTNAKVKKIYSNQLKFVVKKLPDNVTLIGDFEINANVDKTKIKQGEGISYKLNITGIGNFDDIQDIKLDIANATIYDNKPEIKTKYSEKGYEGTYTKVYSIIPNDSLEIPSITFKYFNKKENKVVIKKTKSIKIEVENQVSKKVVLEKPKEVTEVKKDIVIKKESSFEDKLIFFVLGVIFTLLIIGLFIYVRIQLGKKTKKDMPLIKLVKGTKNKKDMMKVLVPFIKSNPKLDNMIIQCESEKDFKVLKKEIIELLKEIKI